MTIVCGTDFSEAGQPALRAAGALASRTVARTAGATPGDARLCLVHVIDPAVLAKLGSDQQARTRAEAADRLAEISRELGQQFGLSHVDATILVGSPGDALVDFADANRAAWLVVASQGHAASPLYQLGGTSERVAAGSRVPVLVVRDQAPFEAWARGERALRVVVGVDWTKSSDAAVHLIKTLREAGPCDVVVAHVYYRDEAAGRYGLPPAGSPSEGDPRMAELLSRDLARRVGELGGHGNVVFRPSIGVGRLGDHLLQVADAEKADLIVVGTHHRRGLHRLTSVSSVVLHFGHASVALVPQPIAQAESAERRAVRRIVVAASLSSPSHYVVEQGYALLGDGGGDVHLVHVVGAHEGRKERDGHDDELTAKLRALAPRWAAKHAIVTHTDIVRSRDVPRAICEAAARAGADLICVGMHDRANIVRAALGSVARDTIQRSQLPVLVVRPLPP